MREGLTRHQPRFPAPVSVNLTSPGRPSVVCASDWAGAPCRWTTTYGYANAIERLWAGLESNLRKPGLRPVAGLLSHPPQQADCARTKNSQSALCRRYSPEGRSEETIGLPNWHTGVGRPSQGGAYRFRRWRYGLVRSRDRRAWWERTSTNGALPTIWSLTIDRLIPIFSLPARARPGSIASSYGLGRGRNRWRLPQP